MLPRANDIMVKNDARFYIASYRRLLKITEIQSYFIVILLLGFIAQLVIAPVQFRYYVSSIDGRVFSIRPVKPVLPQAPASSAQGQKPPSSPPVAQ